jgi:catechol 2,3-dioxygenase-like lactoylglutathione lyase family enzyme
MTVQDPPSPVPRRDLLAHVTVGVADLWQALKLWHETFGFQVLARRTGPDPVLAGIWGVEPSRIVDQALVGLSAGAPGRLHLIQLADPVSAVRDGASPTDLCPKNLDLLCQNLPSRVEELRDMGFVFRSDWVEYAAGELTVREVQMPGHDHTNVVLLELLPGDAPFNARGFAGLAALVTTVPDIEAECSFYETLLGWAVLHRHRLAGAEVETMVGLPPGGALEICLLGEEETPLGRLELVQYRGAGGRDLYPRACLPALGTLHAVVTTADVDVYRGRARAARYPAVELGEVRTLFSSGPALAVTSPAGFRLEIHQGRGSAEVAS